MRRATRPGTHQRLGWHFYPRSPCGERRARECARGPLRAISIHALLAESDRIVSVCSDNTSDISIHALLAESDRHISPPTQSRYCISIHALLAESDRCPARCPAGLTYFYPRSPCGERLRSASPQGYVINFYPRSPCGERLCFHRAAICNRRFLSTLSLRRATPTVRPVYHYQLFLSTLSLRRATRFISRPADGRRISIHALLAESDT